MGRADHAFVVEHESAFRTAIGVMLAPPADDSPRVPRRPGNRLHYLAEALAPIADRMDDERLERLVMVLAMCVGLESIMVMEDICGLMPEEADVGCWRATPSDAARNGGRRRRMI